MATSAKYIPIAERVRVGPRQDSVADSELLLLVRPGEMVRFDSSPCCGLMEREAGDIRNAIRTACEAVRERCAELVDAFAGPEESAPQELIAWGKSDPEALCRATADALQKRIAAAIRSLDL